MKPRHNQTMTGSDFSFDEGGPDAPSGLAPGTVIATPEGPRRIETLGPGDAVCAASGGILTVLWCAQTKLRDAAESARPVRFKDGALGARALFDLAPGTPVLVDRRDPSLVPAAWLGEGGVPKVRVARGQAHPTYHHLLLSEHAVLDIGGVYAGSFYPTPRARAWLEPGARRALHFLLPKLAGAESAAALVRAYGPPAHPFLTHDEFALLREEPEMIVPGEPVAGAA
jgi:hypothetical protein